MERATLTPEQESFLKSATRGQNVLVEACVGSGKTTAIQALCNAIPATKKILYLTYSRLLKIDAQSKIKNKNATVQNYHGFAYKYAKVGFEEQIEAFLALKPEIDHYDLLVLDEYQDIYPEIANMLMYIKSKLPNIQIVAVGDMQQKISDKTPMDMAKFIGELLGENHITKTFTTCFRLNKTHANKLGRIWDKKILGANKNNKVEYKTEDEVFDLLLDYEPRDILCLGSRTGRMSNLLADLEDAARYKFNKDTVYASIRDRDGQQADLNNEIAIFTTYDSCKGLERKICVVFDFDRNYWDTRLSMPDQNYEILRNIFCVAASRGRERIIFVKGKGQMLDEKTLSTRSDNSLSVTDYAMSSMFDFKYPEDVDKCFKYLKIEEIPHPGDTHALDIIRNDGKIDLSPCIGTYQEADFFEGYSIDNAILNYIINTGFRRGNRALYKTYYNKEMPLDKKILFLTALETSYERYCTQVKTPFISEENRKLISQRLATHFSPKERVQVRCSLPFFISTEGKKDITDLKTPCFEARGFADVVKDNIVYELKFVSHVERKHFLQLASYMVALQKKKGRLINILDNKIYEITVTNKPKFLDSVAHAITKQRFKDYVILSGDLAKAKKDSHEKKVAKEHKQAEKQRENLIKQRDESIKSRRFSLEEFNESMPAGATKFALIDVETSFADDVISIGIVISDDISFKARKFYYFRIAEQQDAIAMFSNALDLSQFVLNPEGREANVSYAVAVNSIKQMLEDNAVKHIFAYNASFDKRHLPELTAYNWCDIIEKAAYRQTNKKIPLDAEFWGTGRMKKGFGVEPMYRILADDAGYWETHNALVDAFDELEIMRLLGYGVGSYAVMK